MYSNKESVNILTALLVSHGVNKAVVCPGSRNAPIVHNLCECPFIDCYPVTDERSAGFFALGLALQMGKPSPVVVCVTSGTALLNLLPAVAEASYQHVPLIVVSADRPQQWIEQLDGQTLPQPDALGRFVRKAVSLPLVNCSGEESDETRWLCNRLVNEALLDMLYPAPAPVHINVPIDEPLFGFDTPKLPDERTISRFFSVEADAATSQPLLQAFSRSVRPIIVIGQTADEYDNPFVGRQVMEQLSHNAVVLTERLCRYSTRTVCFDEVLHAVGNNKDYQPDLVIYVGGSLVSKRLKKFLRAGHTGVYVVNADGAVYDTFMHLKGVVVAQPSKMLAQLSEMPAHCNKKFYQMWQQALAMARQEAAFFQPSFSQMAAVRLFEQSISRLPLLPLVHYANSTAVRLANIYAQHPIFCNRGVNGIEGSLSTAAGMAAATSSKVCCVIGDLSFFYDQNALWNQNLGGNLRILLLNNGQGGIFRQLRGLEKSDARERFVAGAHNTSAEGICRQCDVGYRHVATEDELASAIDWLLATGGERPRLVEVTTDAETDAQMLREYYMQLSL